MKILLKLAFLVMNEKWRSQWRNLTQKLNGKNLVIGFAIFDVHLVSK